MDKTISGPVRAWLIAGGVALLAAAPSATGQQQANAATPVELEAFGVRVTFANPDPTRWLELDRRFDAHANRGLVMLTHAPTAGEGGDGATPVLALVFTRLDEAPSSAERYASESNARMGVAVDWRRRRGDSLIYSGRYRLGGVEHRILVAYSLSDEVSIRLMADATAEAYPAVKRDFETACESLELSRTAASP